ncbi:MAG TPA: nicotinate-nicotinamide nucleotide adenylyltransferase [Gaiellaceae bacterium]|nr:nicotinate-nicotinamide nucleotide adenylyltransferase [Gaiellaceae bacterium]
MTVGLFGASFDPPHDGHLALVAAAREQLGLARIVVLVTVRPAYKRVATDAETRLALARAAFPGCEIETEESTTDVTVRDAEARFGEVVFLIGADQFVDFPTWHDPDAVLGHARLAVATRPGYARERLQETLARVSRPERVLFFEIPALAISSRDIRARVARGEPVGELVPPAVAELIRARGLYRP